MRNSPPRRFRAGGVEHPRAQHTEFELADLAFHPEQETIIRVTGIIDAILIDDPRFDQTAQLKKMAPVTAVSRNARRLETNHRADVASAQPGDEAFEARPCDCAAGRQAEIVIDYLNLGEPMVSSDVHEVVLTAPTFDIVSHLRRGGLANIDHGLACQKPTVAGDQTRASSFSLSMGSAVASRSKPASAPTAASRSVGPRPQSFGVSNGMLS